MSSLLWPDYLILAAFLAISIGIGVYHSLTGGKQKTTSEFIMANRALGVLPTSISVLVSFQSAIVILGMTAEMYLYGSSALFLLMFGFVISISSAALISVPLLYPLKLVSVNEYFERRFSGRSVRILASSMAIISGVSYMASAMYAPSAALESASGLSIKASIPVLAVVAIAYTALGGMRAVIWTDVFQAGIMFAGILTILIKGFIVGGGVEKVFQSCSQTGRINFPSFSPDPTVRHTLWSFMFGFSLQWAKAYGFSQTAVQRFSATKSITQAKLSLLLNIPALLIFQCIVCTIGLIVVGYFASERCDPLANGDVNNANKLLVHFVVKIFSNSPGFAGLFLATLYGGALSSISSSLSGAAANCWEDILKEKLSYLVESRKALLNRILVIIFGASAIAFAFLISAIPGPISQIAIMLTGVTNGPLHGLFILGCISRYANWKGALVGGSVGFLSTSLVITGSVLTKTSYPTLSPLSTDMCQSINVTTRSPPPFDAIGSTLTDDFALFTEGPTRDVTTNYHHSSLNHNVSKSITEQLFSISYLWYHTIGLLVTVLLGTIVSLLFRDKALEKQVDDNLLINFRNWIPCRKDSKAEMKLKQVDYDGKVREEKHDESQVNGRVSDRQETRF